MLLVKHVVQKTMHVVAYLGAHPMYPCTVLVDIID